MDEFAQIAAKGMGGRMELLEETEPKAFDKKVCVLDKTAKTPFYIKPKMSTKEELTKALEKMRAQYKPFLENYAPEVKAYAEKIDITEFNVNGEKVKIPEYGGPLGKHRKTYTTEVVLPKIKSGQRAYIHFEGADYRAAVSVNGNFAGEHEGFFSSFEFEITDYVCEGKNTVSVDLYNDNVYMGSKSKDGTMAQGDKMYAATGLGWNDSEEGWHHCPPGMGIYNSVYIEIRNNVHITDVFVRPLENSAEAWVEIESGTYGFVDAELLISVYGQNFKETVFENLRFVPGTIRTVGMCDSLTAAVLGDEVGSKMPMPLGHGKNMYKVSFEIPNAKKWDLETPYLYQIQVSVEVNGKITDTKGKQFGIRSFIQDTENSPKGMFYLNGRQIRLRGANTMGFEQQDVLRGDFDQLIDDILLAKLCNMNFFRLTQRPVQPEVYNYCDRLGLMTQTDLPLFGCMRRFKVAEGIRQAEEMERLIRSHPSSVIVSYINEPFPNADNSPHRQLERHELEQFFTCCDIVVKMQNPDRVIKHVDGDYDPPTESMPDNHCYPMWYNGHGIDVGRLHKGYWIPVRPDWYYGCGEYGAEGLENAEIMRSFYPKKWLAEPFDPRNIVRAQTGDFHYFFYDTPDNMEEWIEKSQQHQAFATKFMTEAFRRNERMISHAIHLFIDAWPSGWMKTIMDFKRNPKLSYFAYRNALEPLMLSLRTDKFTYTVGETVSVEVYICNDTEKTEEFNVLFELYNGEGKLCKKSEVKAVSRKCKTDYITNVEFGAETAKDREKFTLKAILVDKNGNGRTYAEENIEVFADCEVIENENVVIIQKLPAGTHEIAGETVVVKECGMLPLHFVSRKTGHEAVSEFSERDFSYWYNKKQDMITPILETTFTAEGFTPILTSGNKNKQGKWVKTLAAAEKVYEGKRYIICQLDLRCENPVAKRFLRNLYRLGEK